MARTKQITGSAPVVETDTSGNYTAEYIFFGGKRVAMRKPDGWVHYYFADQIGSANLVTNAEASVTEEDISSTPTVRSTSIATRSGSSTASPARSTIPSRATTTSARATTRTPWAAS